MTFRVHWARTGGAIPFNAGLRCSIYAYADGRMTEASDADSTYQYEYDDLGRLIQQTQTFADLTPAIVLDYTYDDVGNCTQVAATIGGTADYVTDYSYDDLGRVTSIRQHGVTGGNAVAEKRIDFTYDGVGQYATITRCAAAGVVCRQVRTDSPPMSTSRC